MAATGTEPDGDKAVRRHLSTHKAIVARRLQRARAAQEAQRAMDARRAKADAQAMAARFDPVVQAANREQQALIASYLAQQQRLATVAA